TRFSRDWSSDVCSSDLAGIKAYAQPFGLQRFAVGPDTTDMGHLALAKRQRKIGDNLTLLRCAATFGPARRRRRPLQFGRPDHIEIGRAPCRARVDSTVR